MKKLLITLVLFMLALTVIAAPDLTPLLKDQDYHLNIGIQLPKTPAINDFSQPFAIEKTYDIPVVRSAENIDSYLGPIWYKQDFAESPFDGTIELLVIGESLPTPAATLLAALLTAGIIIMYTHKSSKQEKTLIHQ